MMGKIYAFRHGETDYNKEKRYAGKLDVSLNQDGITQARILNKKLKHIVPDKAYCSPQLRARQTLKIVLENHPNAELIYDKRLEERDFGSVTGSFKNHISDEYPQYQSKDIRFLWNFKTKSGESFADLEKKITPLLKEIEEEARKGKNIIISTHSGPLRIIRKYFEKLSEDETLEIENLNAEIISYILN